MIQYIYFVKCPNCEDEHFEFFDEAKDFALGCLSCKPIITQTEVCRNDFGECTDSKDLGTIWSWEDMMKDVPEDTGCSVFTKDDLKCCDIDHDPEFAALDNSLDVLDEVPDNFRKPIPEGMTIEQLVEAMEENEDTVECVCCQELYPKEDCEYNENYGWICPDCADEVVECKWCDELFDKSECRYEVDLGWLCPQCEAAIKSRGEKLTFRESCDNCNKLKEEFDPKELVDLDYDSITTEIVTKVWPATYWEPEDYDTKEITDSYTYRVAADNVADYLLDDCLSEEDIKDVPGGFDALEDKVIRKQFLDKHFHELVEKYYQDLLDYYETEATEAAGEAFYDNWHNYDPYED